MLTSKKKNQPVADSNLYKSPEKMEVRKKLLHSHPNPKWILTFGGMRLIDAKMFQQQFGYCHIVSLEWDPNIWREQIQEAEGMQLNQGLMPLNMPFSEFINISKSFPQFDLIYLDFNGIYNRKMELDMDNFLPCLKRGSTLGVTLVKAHDGLDSLVGTYCFNSVCSGRLDFFHKNRAKVISQTFSTLAAKSGVDLREDYCYEYTNTGDKMPMLFLLFKVI